MYRSMATILSKRMETEREGELLAEANRITDEIGRLVEQGEAGSYIEYLWHKEHWLHHLAANAPLGDQEPPSAGP